MKNNLLPLKLFFLKCLTITLICTPNLFSHTQSDALRCSQSSVTQSMLDNDKMIDSSEFSTKSCSAKQLRSKKHSQHIAVRVFDVYLDIGIFSKPKVMYAFVRSSDDTLLSARS